MCCTINTGTGNAGGSFDTILASAAGPPVEAPIATTFTSGREPLLRAGAGSRPTVGGRRVTTRTLASSLTDRTMAPACASNCGLAGPNGFARTVRAPASIALNDQATSSGWTALIITMGVGVSRMIRRVASKPSITGICTSIVTRSGASRAVSRTASAPFTASPATVMSGSVDRMWISSRREEGESSTTRTRGMPGLRSAAARPRGGRSD